MEHFITSQTEEWACGEYVLHPSRRHIDSHLFVVQRCCHLVLRSVPFRTVNLELPF